VDAVLDSIAAVYASTVRILVSTDGSLDSTVRILVSTTGSLYSMTRILVSSDGGLDSTVRILVSTSFLFLGGNHGFLHKKRQFALLCLILSRFA